VSVSNGYANIHTVNSTVTGIVGNSINTVQRRAERLAEEIHPSGSVLKSRSITSNEFTNSVTVTDELESPLSGDILDYSESLTYTVRFHIAKEPVKDGTNGTWYYNKVLPTEVIVQQSGTLRSTRPPTVPEPLVTGRVIDKSVTPTNAERDERGREVIYEKSWSYTIDASEAGEPTVFEHPASV
jgi:hypothetical protein